MWPTPLLVAALAATAALCPPAASALMIDGCPSGTFPVSVLEDPEIHCLSGRPCSGTYSAAGLPQGVGACPANTGCALLPGNEAIMGCVPAGRGDVAYVNADGSLTRGGKLVSSPASSSAPAPAATTKDTTTTMTTTNDVKKTDGTSATTTTTTTTTDDANTANSSGSKAPSSASATVKPGNTDGSSGKVADASASSAIGSQSAGASNTTADATKTKATDAPTTTPVTTVPSITVASPEPTAAAVTSQQTLADIDGDTKTNQGDTAGTGVGITSIIGIVVGCLAVVAVVAGVRLLKKDKEAVVDTPEGGMLDDYGGGITPKENVVLL